MWLTAAAVVLLVPATAAMLGVSRSPHKAAPRGLERRLRTVVGAVAVGLGALLVAALLGAGPVSAVAVAAVLAVAVLAHAPSRDGWAVRGVVVRGLLVAAVAGGLLWLAYRAVSFGPSLPLLGLLAALLGVSGLAALRLLPWIDAWVDRRAGLGPETGEQRPVAARLPGPALLRGGGAAVALGALVLPAATVAVVTAAHTDDVTANRPEAGSETTHVPWSTDASSPGPTRSASPSAPSATTPPATSAVPVSTPATPVPTPTRPAVDAAPSPEAPAGTDAPSPEPSSAQSSAEPAPSESPSGLPTLLPWPSPEPEETKTPGYAKEKPNRPSDAPSPGGGQG